VSELQDDILSKGYTELDEERFVNEPPKRAGRRAFARDRARVLHSAGLRRLAAKTQVLAPGADDFPRTRLTHTLEVAQIGRELGEALSADPDLVETACLTHDLGHPPFGHNGETALHEIAKDFGGFEGNAQTLRILTRLESKTFYQDRSVGLNLTRASLDASTKYPWGFDGENPKFGFYEDDREIFEWVRKYSEPNKKTFECQIMDFADDIAYSVHDFEDAIHSNLVDLDALKSKDVAEELFDLANNFYGGEFEVNFYQEQLDYLLAQPYWVTDFDRSQVSVAKLKNMTSNLIGYFAHQAEQSTKNHYFGETLKRYEAELVLEDKIRAQILILKSIANLFMLQRRGASEYYRKERDIIDLLYKYFTQDPSQLDRMFFDYFENANNENSQKRVIIDQIASLTDASAYRIVSDF
jgi:dGTPase